MHAFLLTYSVIGLFLFLLTQFLLLLGRNFDDDRFRLGDMFWQFLVFGVLWPIGLFAIVAVMRRKNKVRRRGRK
jgi:cell shape-determining protein MreD